MGVDYPGVETLGLCLFNLGSLDLTLVIAIPTVLVLVPTILIVGLAVVLHGRKTGWSDLVCHRWRTVTGISLVEICCGSLRDVFLDIVTINVAIGGWTILVRMTTPASYTTLLDCFYRSGSWSLVFLIENQCSNHIFRQQTSDEQLVVEDSYSLLKQSLASVIDELWTCLIDDY
ncbi:hypothetical protein Tco_0010655 [Tanacetum coccineum]